MTPDWLISIDGKPVSSAALNKAGFGRLISATITDNSGNEADTIEFTIVRDPSMALPPVGAEIIGEFGYLETGRESLGMFFLDKPGSSGSTSGHTMRLTGTAADMSGSLKEQRTKSYDRKTVNAIVQEVAGRNGLTPRVSGSIGSITIPHIDQTQESDMNFLTRLAGDVGATFKISDKDLLFVDRGTTKTASGIQLPAIELPRTISYEYEAGERENYKSVKATWHDQEAAKRQEVVVGSGSPQKTLTKSYATKDEAERAAKAALKDGNASGERLKVTDVGNTAILAESKLTVPALVPEIGGDWTVQRAVHQISTSGYTTEAECERVRE
ncbi:putative bacteriophage late control D protein [Roseibium sp. TrichSKD4]|uniref:contractile injection system protein, VgrG/Pvc8 family n=1 Tax=Roseibium sp. TrichSKD4 TaxID=744980 RepID=UPI0001E575AC|nr:contractile injection system protein, VgrG/Pvc8 family [Roseibium sp. TrichSKD4]EFO30919.1 putative bacteriophage late control D protein [Roseibium sp. TrichSKD4]